MKKLGNFIDTLEANEVFVFGTNAAGFHGAGAAGYAMLHVSGNQWRTTDVPGTAKYLNEVPDGTKGYWAVKGISRGIMQGLYGKSYGIQTVTKPGMRRSVSLNDIYAQLVILGNIATVYKTSNYTFYLSKIGQGYAGYSEREIEDIIIDAKLPSNVIELNENKIQNSD